MLIMFIAPRLGQALILLQLMGLCSTKIVVQPSNRTGSLREEPFPQANFTQSWSWSNAVPETLSPTHRGPEVIE